MKFFNQDEKSVLDALGTSAEKGLNDEQVAENRQKYGENVIAEEKKKSIFSVFLEQFADLMVIILIIASVISILTDNAESAIVILVVITMNAVLGTVQHIKAQKSLASLKAMSSPNAKIGRAHV